MTFNFFRALLSLLSFSVILLLELPCQFSINKNNFQPKLWTVNTFCLFLTVKSCDWSCAALYVYDFFIMSCLKPNLWLADWWWPYWWTALQSFSFRVTLNLHFELFPTCLIVSCSSNIYLDQRAFLFLFPIKIVTSFSLK